MNAFGPGASRGFFLAMTQCTAILTGVSSSGKKEL
jgi:hypothetical protein